MVERRWTPKEDELFRRMAEANIRPELIAAKLNRSIHAIKTRAYTIGLPLKWFKPKVKAKWNIRPTPHRRTMDARGWRTTFGVSQLEDGQNPDRSEIKADRAGRRNAKQPSEGNAAWSSWGWRLENDCVMPRIRWTPEEDERLFDLIAAGKSWTLISGMLKRSMKSVKLHAKERLKAERLAREAAGTPVPAKKAKTREKPR
jgi:hypothetical protein